MLTVLSYFSAPLCPPNSHYSPCVPVCSPTCTHLNGPPDCNQDEACKPGCVCNDGFVRKGRVCVPIWQCGCVDENGKKYQVNGKRILTTTFFLKPFLIQPLWWLFVSPSLMKNGTPVIAVRNVSVKKKTGWARLNAMTKTDVMKMPSASRIKMAIITANPQVL